jgi:hypothetical protein
MHKSGEETCIVHMSSSFVLVIADKGLSKGNLAEDITRMNKSTADRCH